MTLRVTDSRINLSLMMNLETIKFIGTDALEAVSHEDTSRQYCLIVMTKARKKSAVRTVKIV